MEDVSVRIEDSVGLCVVDVVMGDEELAEFVMGIGVGDGPL